MFPPILEPGNIIATKTESSSWGQKLSTVKKQILESNGMIRYNHFQVKFINAINSKSFTRYDMVQQMPVGTILCCLLDSP